MALTAQTLEAFGLDSARPPVFFSTIAEIDQLNELHPYAHFMRRAWESIGLDGIFCVQRKPTVYFKQVDRIQHARMEELHRKVWNQGVAAILVVCSPNEVRIFSALAAPKGRVGDKQEDYSLVDTLNLVAQAFEVRHFLARVETGKFYQDHVTHFPDNRSVDQTLLENLSAARDLLHQGEQGLDLSTAHAVLGRIIFTCYLTDRGIITEREFREAGAPVGVENLRGLMGSLTPGAAKRCLYRLWRNLQVDFNGSMFDESVSGEAAKLNDGHISIIASFLNGEELKTGQLTFDLWIYNFEVIPVETISAIYEDFLAFEDAEGQRDSGAYYTPKHLAELVADIAIEGLGSLLDKRILDPSCGSGIFLVVLFNRIAEEWRRANPNVWNRTRARKLIEIIETQLCGVDVNATACRITCFSLYLAFLDQLQPREIHELHADGGQVLPDLLALKEDNYQTPARPVIIEGNFFDDLPLGGAFDLVIGNPPWVGRSQNNATAYKWCISKRNPGVARAPKIKADQKAYFMPQDQLAHAFMWKAPIHLKSAGRVCLLLPSKVLLNRTDTFQAGLLQAYSVDRITLLSDYRFVLFENAISPAVIIRYGAGEPASLNQELLLEVPKVSGADPRRGVILVGPEDHQRVKLSEIVDAATEELAPVAWKKRFWGTPRDRDLIERLLELPTVDDIVKTREWEIGQGVQPDLKGKAKEPQYPWWKPQHLFINARSPALDLLLLEEDCEPIGHRFPQLYFARREEIFRGPLVLVNQGFTKCAFVDFDVIFQDSLQSFAAPQRDRHLLKFLVALLRSRLARYFLFHTAANWGTERTKVHFYELVRLPLPLPRECAAPDRGRAIMKEIDQAFSRFEKGVAANSLARDQLAADFDRSVEPLLFEYYGVTAAEASLIADTLEIIEPSITPRSFRADVPTLSAADATMRAQYVELLCQTFNHLTRRSGFRINGRTILSSSGLSVVVFKKGTQVVPYSESDADEDFAAAMRRLARATAEPQGRFVHLRDIKLFVGEEIYIVKAMTRRVWSRIAALNDADEIAGAILATR